MIPVFTSDVPVVRTNLRDLDSGLTRLSHPDSCCLRLDSSYRLQSMPGCAETIRRFLPFPRLSSSPKQGENMAPAGSSLSPETLVRDSPEEREKRRRGGRRGRSLLVMSTDSRNKRDEQNTQPEKSHEKRDSSLRLQALDSQLMPLPPRIRTYSPRFPIRSLT